MERKKYISPVCTVMEMKVENALLATSQGEVGNPTTGIGQVPTDYDDGGSGNIWNVD